MSLETKSRTFERLSTVTAAAGVPVLRPQDAPLITLPDVTQRWKYGLCYWNAMVRNLSGPHALRPSGVAPCGAPVVVTDAIRGKWQRLFDATATEPEPSVPVPYLYNQSVGTLLYTRLIAAMGINFRHLLHVQHETKHWAPVTDWVSAEAQELHVSVRGAWRLGDGKALVALRSAIHRSREQGGKLIGTTNDRFIIRNVPESDLEKLPTGRALLRNLAELRRRDPILDATTPGSVVSSIRLAPDMGKRFGSVSGDFNPVHTTRVAARLFGVKKPFLQGLGVRNAVIRQLAVHERPLTRFNISFASPAYLGQVLRFVMVGDEFEVVDEKNVVVAFGAGSAEA